MKNAQQLGQISLQTLLDRLRDGCYMIPDFQREFEWQSSDIRALMRSIFLDYHIGSLLLWKASPDNFDALACEPIYGFHDKPNPTHIVLDGQQRLTAIYYALVAPEKPAPRRQNRFLYFIHVDKFMDEAYDDAFVYDWTRRGENLLRDRNAQFDTHMFPLAVVGRGGWDLANWFQGYEKYWRDKETAAKNRGDEAACRLAGRNVGNAVDFGKHVRDVTQQYQVAYIDLDRDIEIDKVCDIFTQINSRGVPLDVFDLLNALLKPKGVQLKRLWRNAAQRLDFVKTDRMNVYILQVMSILRQAYCSPKYLYYLLPGQKKTVRNPDGTSRKEVLVPDVADFTRKWTTAVDEIERAIGMLRQPQEFGAVSSQYLPYVSILPVFAAAQATIRQLPAIQQLSAQRKLRHWYWASVFTNRYSGSVESTSTRDFLDLKSWFDNDVDELDEPALIAEFKVRFRNLDLHRETKRGTSTYNGVFNLLVLRGARDWMTGTVPLHGDLDDHHIVPKNWGKERTLDTSIDSVLNRTPLTAESNRGVINDRLPNKYLPRLVEKNGESVVRETLESHLISPQAYGILSRNPFTPSDYEAFITERQRTILEAIEDLLVKERLDLSQRLRDLDAQVEEVELDLRRLIAGSLDDDVTKLPSHVRQKINGRIQAAFKRNLAIDVERYQTRLASNLEYADLRELQETMTNRGLYSIFRELCPNKTILDKYFDQLAELRNGIRHSRRVDDVTRMDGEAALLWFRRVVDKWNESRRLPRQ